MWFYLAHHFLIGLLLTIHFNLPNQFGDSMLVLLTEKIPCILTELLGQILKRPHRRQCLTVLNLTEHALRHMLSRKIRLCHSTLLAKALDSFTDYRHIRSSLSCL
ncbi:hypothetical protein D3C72_576040 [compost metagenome]